ncbi:MAG: Hsp20/alpha crystallin family protein [Thermoanaerobaculia bacterium]
MSLLMKNQETQPAMTPFFDELRRDMEGFWNRPFLFRPLRPFREIASSALEWAPSLDVFDKNGELHVKADLPGVRKEDVTVALENGDLVIRGHREAESEVEEADYYRAERSHGEFYRRMALAFEADPKKIEAKFVDGVLEVTIPCPPEKKIEAKKIDVK